VGLAAPGPLAGWGWRDWLLTEAWRCAPLMWTTASCTEGKKLCLVMAALKKLPFSSWARTGTEWREKCLKLWHPAEPTPPPRSSLPAPALRGTPGPSPGVQLPRQGLWGSDWVHGTTCSTGPLGRPWGDGDTMERAPGCVPPESQFCRASSPGQPATKTSTSISWKSLKICKGQKTGEEGQAAAFGPRRRALGTPLARLLAPCSASPLRSSGS